MSSDTLNLYEVARDYWKVAKRGESEVLNALREGRLTAAIAFPSASSALIDVPADFWKGFPAEKFKVRYKRGGKWRKPKGEFAIQAPFAVAAAIAAVASHSVAEAADAIMVGQRVNLQFSEEPNDLVFLHNPRTTADFLLAGAYLARLQARTFPVVVRNSDFEKFIEDEVGSATSGNPPRRSLTLHDKFWVEAVTFALKQVPGRKNNNLRKHMQNWCAKNEYCYSLQWISDRIVEVNRIIKNL